MGEFEENFDTGDLQDPHDALMDLHHEDERHERDIVLVVDDDESERFLLRYVMAGQLGRFQFIEATSAEHALEILRSDLARRIVLLVTDGTMTGLHGTELAMVVRGKQVYGHSLLAHQVQALRRVPINLITGDTAIHRYQAHVKSGVIQHVSSKPLDVERLGSHIRQAASRMGMRGA